MSQFGYILFTAFYNSNLSNPLKPSNYKDFAYKPLPSRDTQIKALETDELDVLVIGGGATGSGVALDAVTRGLKTGLIELDDFASGASSKSTKLIHGGVRYLEKAIFNFDREQFSMVREALRERKNLLDIAPHLSGSLPIMLPVYKWYMIPWYYVGLKLYDLFATGYRLEPSHYITPSTALKEFPLLKKEGLKGAIVYYDGAHNDSRMCLSIALSAARRGAYVANHVAVIGLVKDIDKGNKITGARVKDQLNGREWTIKAKCVVNATGPHTDSLRLMDDPEAKKICRPSSGTHIVLPGYYSPRTMGLLDPATKDGRVIFFLPWQKYTIAGTTDKECDPDFHPGPTEEDIQFILKEVENYIEPGNELRRSDVLAAWTGIRPLVMDPKKKDSQSLVRSHLVEISNSGLVTISGGKWTTYRSMAEDTVDNILEQHEDLKSKAGPCRTIGLKLEGGDNWTPTLAIRLAQDFGLEPDIAQHICESYGDRSYLIAELAKPTGRKWPKAGIRIHPELPYIEAEVRFATHEYAATAIDVIARRMRISFLNVTAAEEALEKIVDIMGDELKWSKQEKQKQIKDAIQFMESEMGLHHEIQDGHNHQCHDSSHRKNKNC